VSVAERVRVLRVGPAPATPASEALLVRGPDVRCAFCHDGFAPEDAPLFCACCRALLHDGCWREAGRCPSLGCRGPGAAARRPRRDVALLAAALHGLTLSPWALGALLVLPAGANVVVVAAFLLAVAFLVLPRLPRADSTSVLALSGFTLAATLVLVVVQSQRAFLTVS
jgi:hypothetical protein